MRVRTYRAIVNQADSIVKSFETGNTTSRRCVMKVWQHILLCHKEEIIIKSCPEELTAKSIGAGIYEITVRKGGK